MYIISCVKGNIYGLTVVAFIDLSCYEEGNIRDNVQLRLHAYRGCYVGITVVWSVFVVGNSRQNKILHFLMLTR